MATFIRDDTASIEMPVRLVVYVILAAAIIAITTIGLSQIRPGITGDVMEKQIGEIRVLLDVMQKGGARNLIDPDSPGGNIRTLRITIPEDVEFLAFGVDPDPDNDGNLTNTPDGLTESGNVIFYRSVGGKVRIPLDGTIEFREGRLENRRWVLNDIGGRQYGSVITGKGNYDLTFEMVYDPLSNERYTLIHFTDDLDASIIPYEPVVFPNNLWVSLDPASITTNGEAKVLVMLKDRKGRDAPADGISINLSASLGNLSAANLTTIKGKASSTITSGSAGTSLITATSPGLNPGSAHLTITQEPIILEFNEWIFNEDEILNMQFSTDRGSNYSIFFTGYGTKFSVPLLGVWWPNASIGIDGMDPGEKTIDSESTITVMFNKIMLPAGNHSLNIRLRNDKYIPLVGDTNLYVGKVVLSG